jgi:hypothetical protein
LALTPHPVKLAAPAPPLVLTRSRSDTSPEIAANPYITDRPSILLEDEEKLPSTSTKKTSVRPPAAVSFNDLDSRTEASWAEEFMRREHILPAPEENPVAVPLDQSLKAGTATTRFKFNRKWSKIAHVLALPYLFFGICYRGLWLPEHPPVSVATTSFVQALHTHSNVTLTCTLPLNLNIPVVSTAFATVCHAALQPLPWLQVNASSTCWQRVYDGHHQWGGYRLGCSRAEAALGPTWLELVVQLGCALASYLLKAQLFAFLIETLEIFLLRLKLLRKFNLLTAEPLTDSRFDFYTAMGVRKWLVIQHKVLTYCMLRVVCAPCVYMCRCMSYVECCALHHVSL